MNRAAHFKRLKETSKWDVVIIGGGASGVGVALESVSKGFKTLLVDQSDFGKGTSSKSTKLIHGGIRYLQYADFKLVYEALHERSFLLENASDFVQEFPFVIPTKNFIENAYYYIGTKIYDFLSGSEKVKKSKWVSKKGLNSYSSDFKSSRFKGGIEYSDAQFDDTRFLFGLAKKIETEGGCLLNYVQVNQFNYAEDKIQSLELTDLHSGSTFEIEANLVVTATGAFSGSIKNAPNSENFDLKLSRGTHIVINKDVLEINKGILIPKTSDGRILFALPWHNKILIGTTDVAQDKANFEPNFTKNEIKLMLATINDYFRINIYEEDIKAVFSGLRPLIVHKGNSQKTKSVSRKHIVEKLSNNLINISGGKWTIFRKMGQDVIEKAVASGLLKSGSTTNFSSEIKDTSPYKNLDYNTLNDAKIIQLTKYSCQEEWAVNVEDIIGRRLRLLFLDVEKALFYTPLIANTMASVLNKDEDWVTGTNRKSENFKSTIFY